VNSPPAVRPTETAPAQIRPPASGPTVNVRDADGNLVRKVTQPVAETLIRRGLARRVSAAGHVRLLPGFCACRLLDQENGLPDLDRMRVSQPDRYRENWQGGNNATAQRGHGQVGRTGTSRTVFYQA
jgi:hypothetical protein